jgi:hypothetical protein
VSATLGLPANQSSVRLSFSNGKGVYLVFMTVPAAGARMAPLRILLPDL